MDSPANEIDVSAQLDRARNALGEALGLAQDITNKAVDVESIATSLARAVKTIFSVQRNGLADPFSRLGIAESMDHLRATLIVLQDVRTEDPSLARITGTVARILALLYPVSRLLEEMKRARAEAPPPAEDPIPLTDAGPTSREAARKLAERRIHERRSIEVDIGIHSDTNFFTGFSQDISTGGLFIATFDILDLGTALNINFRLPDGPVLSLDGVVRWVREYNDAAPEMSPGMGVQFENLGAREVAAINRFMSLNQPIFYEED